MSKYNIGKLVDSGYIVLEDAETYEIASFKDAKSFVEEIMKHTHKLEGGDENYKKACKKLLDSALEITGSKEVIAKYIYFKYKYTGYDYRDMQISKEIYDKLENLCENIVIQDIDTYLQPYDDECDDEGIIICDENSDLIQETDIEYYEDNIYLADMLDCYYRYCLVNKINMPNEYLEYYVETVEEADHYIFEEYEFDDKAYVAIDEEYLLLIDNRWLHRLFTEEQQKIIESELKQSGNLNNCPVLLNCLTNLVDKMMQDLA